MPGPHEQLESAFAAWAGVANVVGCASGTAALHLALEALPLPPGSEVIVPDFTMIACARAVTLAGLVPVFVDCGDDLLMDVELLEDAVGERTAALMPVHIYGRRCRMEAVHELAVKYGLFVVEDLAEAHGVPPHPATDAACWSFYRNKIIAGEEGGAVAFAAPRHAALARQLRSLGFTDAHDFRHVPRGHNYRLSNAHAALVLDSLARVNDSLASRRQVEAWHDARCPDAWRMPPRQSPWVYDLRIPELSSRRQDEIVQRLHADGIPARHAFKPMTHQDEYRGCRAVGGRAAARLSREVLYLLLTLSEDQVTRAWDVLLTLAPV